MVHTGVSLTDVTGWVQTYTLVNMSENQAWMDFSNDFWHSNTTKLDTLVYSGKFLRGSNLRDFRDPRQKRKNKNHKKRNCKYLNM